jgi:plasmid replication initiation protein
MKSNNKKDVAPAEHGSLTTIGMSNAVGESEYDLSLAAQKLLFEGLSRVDTRLPEFETIRIPVAEFIESSNLAKNYIYENGPDIAAEMLSASISFREVKSKNEWIVRSYHFFNMCGYKDGVFTLQLSEDMNEHFLSFYQNGRFFRAIKEYIMQFKCTYSPKLYLFCQSHLFESDKKLIYMEVDDVRSLYIDRKKDKKKFYPEFKNLNLRVIKPAIKEINAITDLNVSVETKKEGNYVVGVYFQIESKYKKAAAEKSKAFPQQDAPMDIDDEEDEIIEVSILESVIQELFDAKKIPIAYRNDRKKMELAIKYLVEYELRTTENSKGLRYYKEKDKEDLFKVSVEQLIKMCSSRKKIEINEDKVSSIDVLDKLNDFVQYHARVDLMSIDCSFIDDMIDAVYDAMQKNQIINIPKYVQTSLWNGLNIYLLKNIQARFGY